MAQQFAIYDRCPIIRSPRRRRTSVSTQGDHPQENFPGELPKYNYVSLACLQSLFVSFPPPLFVLCWLFGFSSCVSLPLASVLLCVPTVVLLCSACSLSINPPRRLFFPSFQESSFTSMYKIQEHLPGAPSATVLRPNSRIITASLFPAFAHTH